MELFNYEGMIFEILSENMTIQGFDLWKNINENMIKNIWSKPTSSTGKWHIKENGRCPNQDEHIFEMLYSCLKLLGVYNITPMTKRCDILLLSIVLHDSLKYGINGKRKHTAKEHDKLSADMILKNKEMFLKIYSEHQFNILEECVRYHSGRWSTDIKDISKFDFNDYNSYTLFVHILDMLSTKDLIKIWLFDIQRLSILKNYNNYLKEMENK